MRCQFRGACRKKSRLLVSSRMRLLSVRRWTFWSLYNCSLRSSLVTQRTDRLLISISRAIFLIETLGFCLRCSRMNFRLLAVLAMRFLSLTGSSWANSSNRLIVWETVAWSIPSACAISLMRFWGYGTPKFGNVDSTSEKIMLNNDEKLWK